MSVWRRLERLEKRQGVISRHTPCPECGGLDGAPGPHAQWRVVFQGDGDCGPEKCPACGRRRVFAIAFDEGDGIEFDKTGV